MMSGRTGSHRSCCLGGYVLLHCLCTIREAGPCGRVVLCCQVGLGHTEAVWWVMYSYTVSVPSGREGGRTLWKGSVMMSGRTGSHRSCLVGYVLLHCLCTIREAGPCGRVVLGCQVGPGLTEAVWWVMYSYTVSVPSGREAGPCGRVVL